MQSPIYAHVSGESKLISSSVLFVCSNNSSNCSKYFSPLSFYFANSNAIFPNLPFLNSSSIFLAVFSSSILPPDIISLIEGSEVNIYIDNGNYALKVGEAVILVPVPGIDYKETADVLRGSLPENIDRYPVEKLFDSLKRLSSQSDYVVFKQDRVQAGENYEPFNFPKANPEYVYNIQNLLSVIQQAKHIAQSDYALLLYGDQFLFMISPEPTDEEEEQNA